MRNWARRTFGPLHYRAFRRFWAAAMVSNVGGMVQLVGATWLVSALTSDAQTVALVQTATTLPPMLFALLAGACADVFDRRAILLWAQTMMGVAAAAIAVLAFGGNATPAALLGVTFVIAAGQAFYSPAWQASVREQVPREMLEAASSLNSIGFNVARSVGPAVGGAVVALFGPGIAFAANAVSFVGIIWAIVSWKRPQAPRQLPPEPLQTAIITGILYTRLSPPLLRIMARSMAFGLCGSGIWALTPLLVRDVLGAGAQDYGLILGAFGAGAVGGALIRSYLLRWGRNGVVNGCSLAFGCCAMLLARNTSFPAALMLMAICGASWMLCLTLLSVTVQLLTPNWVAGRTISLNQMAVFAGMAAGSAAWGLVAELSGVATALAASGALMLATLLMHWRFPIAEDVGQDLSPVRLRPIDSPATDLPSEGGSVIVMIDYCVPPDMTEAFLERMSELGRIRKRDGALRWSLSQDIADPEQWVERFHSRTWLEHVRRQVRPTVADEHVRRAVADLVGEPVRVRRLIERSASGRAVTVSRAQPDY